MNGASQTKSAAPSPLRLVPVVPEVGLVDLADPSVSERLTGRVSEQLELFASQMRRGCWLRRSIDST